MSAESIARFESQVREAVLALRAAALERFTQAHAWIEGSYSESSYLVDDYMELMEISDLLRSLEFPLARTKVLELDHSPQSDVPDEVWELLELKRP